MIGRIIDLTIEEITKTKYDSKLKKRETVT